MRLLRTLFAIALLAGCRGSTEPDLTLPGVYALQSIDGRPLPYSVSESDQLMSYRLTITDSANTWSAIGTNRRTVNNLPTTVTGADRGAWTVVAQTITLRRADGTLMWSGPVTPRVLTLKFNSGAAFVFRKN